MGRTGDRGSLNTLIKRVYIAQLLAQTYVGSSARFHELLKMIAAEAKSGTYYTTGTK